MYNPKRPQNPPKSHQAWWFLSYFWAFLVLLQLASCGSNTEVTDGDNATATSYSISLVADNTASQVTPSNPLTFTASLKDNKGNPVASQVLHFSTSTATLSPSNGQAITDAQGQASVTLSAGDATGAGYLDVIYYDPATINEESPTALVTQRAAFMVAEDDNVQTDGAVVTDDYTLTFSYSNSEKTTTSDTPLSVTLTLKDKDGKVVPDQLVIFEGELVSFEPQNGQVKTNASGQASVLLLAGDTTGADLLKVSLPNMATLGQEVTSYLAKTQIVYEVKSGQSINTEHAILMGDLTLSSTNLAYGDETTYSVSFYTDEDDSGTITASDSLYTKPLIVAFSSGCALQSKSTLDASLTTVNGVAQGVYAARSCEGGDTLSATVSLGEQVLSKSQNLNISTAKIGSLSYVGMNPQTIYVAGSGGVGNADVTFKLVNEYGYPMAGRSVSFSLTNTAGGLKLAKAQSTTNSDGLVSAKVQAGTVAIPLQVKASITDTDDEAYSIQSGPIAVALGVPDQNHFSLSTDKINLEAWSYDHQVVQVTANVADFYGNPVMDGTLVTFSTNGGVIFAADDEDRLNTCVTLNGKCSVIWQSQAPRPASGKVVIMAMSAGAEAFNDANGNGLFDTGETLTADLGEPYWDTNANGSFDPNEQFWDLDADGLYTQANAKYDGPMCSDTSVASCGASSASVFTSAQVILSQSQFDTSKLALSVTNQSATTGIQGSEWIFGEGSETLSLTLVDSLNNPLPEGSVITVSANSENIWYRVYDQNEQDYTWNYRPALQLTANTVDNSYTQTLARTTSAYRLDINVNKVLNTQGSIKVMLVTPEGVESSWSINVKDLTIAVPSASVTASDSQINPLDTTLLTYQVYQDQNQTPAANVNLTISMDESTAALFTVSGNQLVTNAQGQATLQLTSKGNAGIGVIHAAAIVNGQSLVASQQVQVDQPQISAIWSDTLLNFNAAETATVTYSLTDASGSPLVGKLITLTLDEEGKTLASPSKLRLVTDANGQAIVTLTPYAITGSGGLTAQVSMGDLTLSQTDYFEVNQAPLSLTGSVANSAISLNQTGSITYTLKDQTGGDALAGVAISISTQEGILSLEQSSKLTDANGQATFIFSPTGASGVEEILASASYQGRSITSAHQIQVGLLQLAASVRVNGVVAEQITQDQVASIVYTLTDKDSSAPLANQLITLSVDSLGAGIVSLSSTQILTDANGQASVTVSPQEFQSGIAKITASTGVASASISNEQWIRVKAPHMIFMDSLVLGSANLGYGGSSSYSVTLYEDTDDSGDLDTNLDTRYSRAVAVGFSSGCALAGSSTLDAMITTVNGVAQGVYNASNCEGSDTLVAAATVGGEVLSQSSSFTIAAANLGSIQFVSASPQQIFIQGSGGVSSAQLTFKVVNEFGYAMSNQKVAFALNTQVGGVTLAQSTGLSSANGEVKVTLNAGKVATPIRVIAEVLDSNDQGTGVRTQSSQLVVSTGIADQRHFSLTADVYNPEAWNYVDTEVKITAALADAQGNPVMDDTQVNFMAESGQIAPSCLTVSGSCTVSWFSKSEGVRPTDHRTTITAYALGNESFSDANGDGQYSNADGEPWDNKESSGLKAIYAQTSTQGLQLVTINDVLDEAFVDGNSNGIYDEPFNDANPNNSYDLGESFVDYNLNGVYDGAGNNPAGETTFVDINGNGRYDGAGLAFAETYQDINSNGAYNSGEPFVDRSDIYGAIANSYDNGVITLKDSLGADISVKGLEAFTNADASTDAQGNPTFTAPGLVDLSEPWLDTDEDGVRSSDEVFVDFDSSGTFTPRNGKYDGFLCASGDALCGEKSSYVRRGIPLVMSSSYAHYWVRNTTSNCIVTSNIPNITSTCGAIAIANGGSVSFRVYIADQADQIMPQGTTITNSASTGKYSGSETITISNSSHDGGTSYSFSISDTDAADTNPAEQGTFNVLVTTPKGNETPVSFTYTLD